MTGGKATAVVKATVHPVIVRACVQCGGKREIGKPCAACGLEDPPVTCDLGVQSAYYRNPFKRLAWLAVGQHLAARRARAANRSAPGREGTHGRGHPHGPADSGGLGTGH